MASKEQITQAFRELQNTLCLAFEHLDGHGRFGEDAWERKGGGGGYTRIMEGGTWIEKGGINFSAVHGTVSDSLRKLWGRDGQHFYATGVSVVMHPRHPYMPIIHMNVRYFELDEQTYWFGGGIDLTPHYVNEEEACRFHQALQKICEAYEQGCYARFKAWADDYFFLPHRGETRGIGGVFFDGLGAEQATSHEAESKEKEKEQGKEQAKKKTLRFVMALGASLSALYLPLIDKHKAQPYTEAERAWQCVRRGRYVEFNLIHDMGTRFGLDTGGRTESILMSLPPQAQWRYDAQPPEGSKEYATLQCLRKGIDWVSKTSSTRPSTRPSAT